MYQQPHLTPDERNRVWLELEHKYRPWIDFADLPFYGRGAGWQRQLHIYEVPFYYLDYCLAQTVALQFFTAFLKDNPQFAQSEAKPTAPKISSKTVSQTPDAEAALLERIKKQM